MAELKKIRRIADTRVNLQNYLGVKQIAIEDDYDNNLSYKDFSGVYHIAANQYEHPEFTDVTIPSLANAQIVAADSDGKLIIGSAQQNISINAYNVSYSSPYFASGVDSVGDALDELGYVPISITSITNDVNIVEKGSTVTDVTVSWVYEGVPETIALTDAHDVELDDIEWDFSGLSLTTQKTYTLSLTDSAGASDSDSTYVRFGLYKYWGQSANPYSTITESIVEAALNGGSTLSIDTSSSKTKSEFQQYGDSAYIYYAYPQSWALLTTLKVNGFNSTWNYAVVSITNASGNTENYYVYVSPYPIAGQVTLEFA